MWPIAELIPHAKDVILLSEIVHVDAHSLQALAIVSNTGPFHTEDNTLPNAIGLEFMAQAIAAWAGYQARVANKSVTLGFLLGTRRYECNIEHFLPGMPLVIDVTCSLQDSSGMGVFEASISTAGETIATARLNVYSPPDVSAFTHEASPGNPLQTTE